MDDDAIERELLRGGRRRWPWVLLAAVLLLAAVFGILRYTLHRRVVVELARIRAAGYPTTLVELDAWYPTPSGANAADVYLEAFNAYVADEELEALLPNFGRDVNFPEPGEPMPDEMFAAMAAYVAENTEALALLAEAATIPECRFPVDLKAGSGVLLTHLSPLRRGAQLLRQQAIVQVQQGQHDRSIDSVLAMLAAARSVRNEPLLISHLVGMSMAQETCRAVEQILGRASLTDSQLARLSQALAGAMGRGTLLHTMAGERALMLGGFDTMMSSRAYEVFANVTGVSDADRSAYLGIMGEVVKKAEDPLGQAVDTDALIRNLPWYGIVTRTFMPELDKVFRSELQGQATARVLLAGLAAKRYQLAHGALPERLDELVGEFLDALPIDPCDDKPLRYMPTDTGAVIYSVGRDGVDDGGREKDAKGDRLRDGTDIVFRLPR